MRTRVVPDNWIERLAIWLGIAPTPLVDTLQAIILARAIMAACKLGIFESLSASPATAQQIADQRDLDRYGTEKLLGALAASGYVSFRDGRYQLTRKSRKWLVAGPYSLQDNMLLRYLEWHAVEQMEQFVMTGQPIEAHDVMPEDAWPTYQRGLGALARLSAAEITKRVPLPRGATRMLDVGGAHGQYALALCQQYPQLHATVLELPEAVASAERVFRESGAVNDAAVRRISFRGGNAHTDSWWQQEWDLVFASQLIHHFTADENRSLVAHAAQSLRPGGVLAIVDAARPATPDFASQTGQLLDLFFAITSRSGTWPIAEVQAWQSAAGLTLLPVTPLRTMPGVVMLLAKKSEQPS